MSSEKGNSQKIAIAEGQEDQGAVGNHGIIGNENYAREAHLVDNNMDCNKGLRLLCRLMQHDDIRHDMSKNHPHLHDEIFAHILKYVQKMNETRKEELIDVVSDPEKMLEAKSLALGLMKNPAIRREMCEVLPDVHDELLVHLLDHLSLQQKGPQ